MKIKKVILVILLFVMLFTSINFVNFNKVEATTSGYTPDTAIEYVKSLLGKTIDIDGINLGECVDLAMAYEKQLSGEYYSGNGAQYSYIQIPNGWTRIQGGIPQKGDILVYTGGNEGYGHVAIYESDNVTYHQNYEYNKTVQRVDGYYANLWSMWTYWGVIRPDFNNSRVAIDSVTEGQTYTARLSKDNYFNIEGWATSDVDGAFVQMYVDDKLAVATHLIERYDRPAVSREPNVGYRVNYGYGDLSEGTHTLKVICHEPSNGNVLAQKTVNFNVIHADMAIDTVKEGDTYTKSSDTTKNDMEIRGWSATKKDSFVQMYVDDELMAATHIITRTQRDDIVGYDNAGYEIKYNYSGLSEGEHILKVITFEEGTNQILISEQVTFNVVKKDTLLGDVNRRWKSKFYRLPKNIITC